MKTLLVLVGIVLVLFFFGGFLTKSLWRLLFLLFRPKMLFLVVGAVLIGGYLLSRSGDSGTHSRGESDRVPPPVVVKADGTRVPPTDPVTYPAKLPALPSKAADGNSRFAVNLLTRMNKDERRYYSRELYHAIEDLPEGEAHRWLYQSQNRRMFGRIVAKDRYTAPNGSQCRNFDELLVWHSQAQNLSGSACRQGNGAWCKLRRGSTLSCNLKPPGGLDGSIMGFERTMRRLF